MKNNLKLFLEKERNFIRITGKKYGVIYFIRGKQVDLNDSFLFETNEEGRCIGFEVIKEEIGLEEFDAGLREFAQENGWAVVERQRSNEDIT